MQKIKLIWDFRGSDATQIASHHEKHLKEYGLFENLELRITGFETKTELHAIAFMVVYQKDMIAVRDALKPHRGEVY